MEIKCDICGTINDGSTNFCKGCFQKLDAERKQNIVEEEKVVNVIQSEETRDVPWNNDEIEIEKVEDNIPKIDNWEMASVNGETKSFPEKKEEKVAKDETEETITKEEETAEPVAEEVGEIPVEGTTEEVQKEQPTEVESSETWDMPTDEEVTNIENNEQKVDEKNIVDEPVNENTDKVTADSLEVSEEPIEEDTVNEETEPVVEELGENEEIISSIPYNEEVEKTVEPIEENVTVPVAVESVEESKTIPEEEIIEPIAELSDDNNELEKIDDWSKDPIEEEEPKKEPNFILKFLCTYLISSIVIFGVLLLTTKYLNNIFDNVTSDIVSFMLYRLAGLVTLLIAAKITFMKEVPKIENLNKITFKMLGFIAVPGILIQLFVLGFLKDTKVLMFIIGVMLSLIILVIFFSYIRNSIKKRNKVHIDDKVFFIYGIVNIVIIIILLGLGIYARSHDLNMPKINSLYDVFNNTENDEEIVEKFIEQIQLRILEAQSQDENYQVPSEITDVEFAAYDEYKPDEISIKLNEGGAIVSGTITYHGIKYIYDGEKIKTI